MSQDSKPPVKKNDALWSLISGVGWPLMMGSAVTGVFYALLLKGPLHHPTLMRYFAHHPINVIETLLFFIGIAGLVAKAFDVMRQQAGLKQITLGSFEASQPVGKAGEFLDVLAALPRRLQETYLGQRLIEALEMIERMGSAEKLEDELKYLSDMDSNRQQESYSLIRIVIWAVPMLGFLGTVVGITDALSDLGNSLGSESAGGNGLQGAMQGLLAGLYVKFDSTAIALCFSILLVFIQYGIDRVEIELLGQVDRKASQELVGRFELVGASSDPQLQSIHRMSQMVVAGTEQLVLRQAELWQQTINAAHGHWERLQQQTGQQLQTALTASLGETLDKHATNLARIERSNTDQMLERWEKWQGTLHENSQVLHAQQQEMARQGELMTQAIRAAGDVVQLERALNSNLGALAGAKNFEETVMSLAAAIHLLNNRLGRADATQVELTPQVRSRAA